MVNFHRVVCDVLGWQTRPPRGTVMVDAKREVDFFKECLPLLFPLLDPEAPLVPLPKLVSLLVLVNILP